MLVLVAVICTAEAMAIKNDNDNGVLNKMLYKRSPCDGCHLISHPSLFPNGSFEVGSGSIHICYPSGCNDCCCYGGDRGCCLIHGNC